MRCRDWLAPIFECTLFSETLKVWWPVGGGGSLSRIAKSLVNISDVFGVNIFNGAGVNIFVGAGVNISGGVGVISVLILSLFLAWRNVRAQPITGDNHISRVGRIKCLTCAEIFTFNAI